MSRVNATAAAGFWVGLPPGWWDLPLDVDDRLRRVEDLVVDAHPDLSPGQHARLTSVLLELTDIAVSSGALQCAGSVMTDDAGSAVIAGLIATVIDAPPDDDNAVAYLSAVVLTGRGPGTPVPDECALVDLPGAKQALRVRGGASTEQRVAKPEEVLPLDLRYFVRLPGDARAVVLAFHSPHVARQETADQLVALFDALAETFCFVDDHGAPLPTPPEP